MGIFSKGSKLYSIFKLKCPKCHVGEQFPTRTFSFSKPFDMQDRCPVCQQKYELEPGFWYGAMLISYVLTGWFCLFFVGGCMWFFEMSVNASFIVLIGFLAIFFVWIFRVSRSIWLNFHVKYDPNAVAKSN